MDSILRETRRAVRSLRRAKALSITAAVALALGVGVTTTMFSAVDQLLVRPLPYPRPDRLMWLNQFDPARPQVAPMLGQARITELRQAVAAGVFERISLHLGASMVITGAGDPANIDGERVDSNFFKVLGVRPAMGRTFLPEEDLPGAAKTIVLSDALWRGRFGADRSILGKIVHLDTTSYTVIGVMPPGFTLAKSSMYWLPLVPSTNPRLARCQQCIWGVGRLKDGVSLDVARARLADLAERNRAGDPSLPKFMRGMRVQAVTLRDWATNDARTKLLVLFGAVCCVLLIACANIANLLLSRTMSRRQEFAVRSAIGASRSRIIQLVLIEAAVLALPAAVLGALLAEWGVRLMHAFIPRWSTIDAITVDARVLAFALGIALLAAFAAALWPAVQASSVQPGANIRNDERSSGSIRHNRFRSAMVVTQVATTFVLLACAALLGKSFLNLISTDKGFSSNRVLTMNITLTRAGYPNDARRIAFRDGLAAQLARIPGVDAVSMSTGVPFAGVEMLTGFNAATDTSRKAFGPAVYSDDRLFDVLGARLLSGRRFTRGDSGVVILSKSAAAKLFPDGDPLGRQVAMFDDRPTVVGVIADMQFLSRKQAPEPQIFSPIDRYGASYLVPVVRVRGDLSATTAAMRAAVLAVDPRQPVARIESMDQLLSDAVSEPRTQTLLLGIFGGLAFFMACLGVYGVVAYTVTQRTREIGVRIALGANQQSVLGLVVKQGVVLSLVGALVGIIAALWSTKLVAASLFGVQPLDPWAFAVPAAVMIAVTSFASYLPARRATRIDPMIALRAE